MIDGGLEKGGVVLAGWDDCYGCGYRGNGFAGASREGEVDGDGIFRWVWDADIFHPARTAPQVISQFS